MDRCLQHLRLMGRRAPPEAERPKVTTGTAPTAIGCGSSTRRWWGAVQHFAHADTSFLGFCLFVCWGGGGGGVGCGSMSRVAM